MNIPALTRALEALVTRIAVEPVAMALFASDVTSGLVSYGAVDQPYTWEKVSLADRNAYRQAAIKLIKEPMQ